MLAKVGKKLAKGSLTTTVTVKYAGRKRRVEKPVPALRQSRDIQSSIRAYERTLAALREQEKQLTKTHAFEAGRFAKFADKKPRERRVAQDPPEQPQSDVAVMPRSA